METFTGDISSPSRDLRRRLVIIMRRFPSTFRARNLLACAALLLGPLVTPARADILYVSLQNNTIAKITSAASGSVFASSGLSNPFGLAFDSAGMLYAANDSGSTIEKFTRSGVGSVFASTGLSGPIGLAFDSAGNLYAADNNGIAKFTPDGAGSVFAGGLSLSSSLAFDSAGNLYASNFNNRTIQKFTPDGVGTVFATALGSPRGLAFDSAGNLYTAISSNNTIEKFTSTGGVLSSTGSVFTSSGVNSPVSLAFDSAGNLYLANGGNDTIEKYTSTGGVLSSSGTVFANSTNGVSGSPRFLAFTNDAGVPLPLANTPEPASVALLGLGACLLAARRRRKA